MDLPHKRRAGCYTSEMWEKRLTYTLSLSCFGLIKTVDNGGGYEWSKETTSL